MNRPTFFILGTSKAGTTSLHHYLAQHPDILMSDPKEPPYFRLEYERGAEYYWRTYYRRWSGQRQVGDGSPQNLYLPFVAPRIAASVPDAKLIVLCRHPVDRAVSAWWHNSRAGLRAAVVRRRRRAQPAAARAGPDLQRRGGGEHLRRGQPQGRQCRAPAGFRVLRRAGLLCGGHRSLCGVVRAGPAPGPVLRGPCARPRRGDRRGGPLPRPGAAPDSRPRAAERGHQPGCRTARLGDRAASGPRIDPAGMAQPSSTLDLERGQARGSHRAAGVTRHPARPGGALSQPQRAAGPAHRARSFGMERRSDGGVTDAPRNSRTFPGGEDGFRIVGPAGSRVVTARPDCGSGASDLAAGLGAAGPGTAPNLPRPGSAGASPAHSRGPG